MFKISMTCVCKKYEIKIKMEQEQSTTAEKEVLNRLEHKNYYLVEECGN